MSFWRFLTFFAIIGAALPMAVTGVWWATSPDAGRSEAWVTPGGVMLFLGFLGFLGGAALAVVVWILALIIGWVAARIADRRGLQ